MKLLAITLLAVCLIQGNSAQFAGLRNLVSSAQNAVGNAASGAVSAATGAVSNARNAAAGAVSNARNAATGAVSNARNAATGAVSNARNAATGAVSNAVNAATNIRNSLSGGAQALLDSASADISVDSLTEAAKNLSPDELLETVNGAAAEVSTRVAGIQTSLEEAVSGITGQAEAALNATSSSWSRPVNAVVKKALAAGVDVKECAVDGVATLVKESAQSAVKCVTDKVNEAVTLAKNIAGLPERAIVLARDGAAAVEACYNTSGTSKAICHATRTVPVAVRSALLVKDTVSYTTQSVKLVSTLKADLSACAVKTAASSSAKALSTSASIVSCVKGKIAGN